MHCPTTGVGQADRQPPSDLARRTGGAAGEQQQPQHRSAGCAAPGVESLRPADERDQMASEWILYNILRLRFLQGKRVKEIVQDLAMSESDFYRKERAAVREVARVLATMENACVERQRQ